ncbi:uncharacterized protein LOC111781942 [Cucurbita pepo subsp. pepo]|uniref:uncharacterized protein LOC111781942 n=1 Tax=Cucurbita pepo subsp. pepo TaxID=3664 RepID=UPI000C9D9D8C|nr:uncharacterized protein LOC111781942 [Cucurbita pepo subsp. pepo]
MLHMVAPPQLTVIAARRSKQIPTKDTETKQGRRTNAGFAGKRKEELWQCVEGCGACCKLAKGPSFASPEEIFQNPSDIELYKSLIGADGWCIHYEKSSRKCSIYADRPYFCRVESPVFEKLYGIKENKFNKVACSSCRDTIKAIYGFQSKELEGFNKAVQGSESA